MNQTFDNECPIIIIEFNVDNQRDPLSLSPQQDRLLTFKLTLSNWFKCTYSFPKICVPNQNKGTETMHFSSLKRNFQCKWDFLRLCF